VSVCDCCNAFGCSDAWYCVYDAYMLLTCQLQTSVPSDSAAATINTDDVMQHFETLAVEDDAGIV